MSGLDHWTARPWPGDAPIDGRLVRLVSLDPEEHADDLWHAFGRDTAPETWEYMPLGPFGTEAEFREGLRWIKNRTDWVPFAILDTGTGRALGTASYMRIDQANGVAEVGCIVYGEGLRRRPGATEAMLLMGERIFGEFGYRRYEWKCDARNAPSRQAAQRLGFQYEGTFRQHMVVKGKNRDTDWFSIIDAEWPAVRARLAAWLDAANFDAEGSQRQRLGDVLATAK